jgi:hypothetical protein
MLSLQGCEILLKGLSDCRLAFSQGLHFIQLILKVDCARWKAERDNDANPRFTRKFNKWKAENFSNAVSLAHSLMHPISRLRLETHVAFIRLKELHGGFRVLSAEALYIESFPDAEKIIIREIILTNQTDEPENVCCEAVFEVQAIESTNNCRIFNGYSFGEHSNLAAIQGRAATENGRQAELIEMLNKEL